MTQMAWCHETGYRGFILEKSKKSKSPRHQRTVNRVNPGVATRLRARLRGKDLRIRREMVTFVHWERWLWVTNPDEAPRTAGCWFFISKMRQLPNLPTTWPYGVAGVEVKPLPDFGRNIDLPWFTIYFDVHQSIRVLTHSHMSMLRYVQICGRPYLSLWYTVHRYTHTHYIYIYMFKMSELGGRWFLRTYSLATSHSHRHPDLEIDDAMLFTSFRFPGTKMNIQR